MNKIFNSKWTTNLESIVYIELMQIYNAMVNDFALLNGLAELPATRSLFVQAAAELKKHLQ
ncbi:hypothetical protein NUACC21_38090 [Scytonema sp. NUACC21]